MAEPLAIWHDEHVNIARLLDLLEAQVTAFHRGDHPNYDLMGDIVFYLRSFTDCVHHPREDVAFSRLAERERAAELLIKRLLQEHRVIAAAGEELSKRLEAAVEDVMIPRAAVETAAATYLVYYRNHLAAEEQELMPRAEKRLTKEDWAAVAAAVPGVPDPLFGSDVQARFRELRSQIDREAALSLEE